MQHPLLTCCFLRRSRTFGSHLGLSKKEHDVEPVKFFIKCGMLLYSLAGVETTTLQTTVLLTVELRCTHYYSVTGSFGWEDFFWGGYIAVWRFYQYDNRAEEELRTAVPFCKYTYHGCLVQKPWQMLLGISSL